MSKKCFVYNMHLNVQKRCSRDKCRYYHPPARIGEALLAATAAPPRKVPPHYPLPPIPRGRSPPASVPAVERVDFCLIIFCFIFFFKIFGTFFWNVNNEMILKDVLAMASWLTSMQAFIVSQMALTVLRKFGTAYSMHVYCPVYCPSMHHHSTGWKKTKTGENCSSLWHLCEAVPVKNLHFYLVSFCYCLCRSWVFPDWVWWTLSWLIFWLATRMHWTQRWWLRGWYQVTDQPAAASADRIFAFHH